MSGVVEGAVLKRVILEKVGNNFGTIPPKHRVKQGSGRYQKARRVNNIAVPA
jgi:hypothetical protein